MQEIVEALIEAWCISKCDRFGRVMKYYPRGDREIAFAITQILTRRWGIKC